MPFNEGQLKAINQRNASILVSAPAGSGKTKILVSRIVELLKEGYNVNEFLVVTFTEAAGNEMKQRLTAELNELISKEQDEELVSHLRKQIQNLPNAYITNFHGFCSLLLKKYGYMVDVLPGFEINSDPKFLKKEVLKECLEHWVTVDKYKDFLSLYFPGYNLDAFESVLLSLDELSHSIDNFYGFVDEIIETCYESVSESLEEWPLFEYLKSILLDEAMVAMDKLVELEYYASEEGLTDFFERPDDQSEKNQLLMIPFESLYDYIDDIIKNLQKPITYDTLVSLLNKKQEKSYNMSWKEVDPNVKETFNKLKKNVLDSFNKAVSTYLDNSVDEFVEKMHICKDAIEILIKKGELLDQFQKAFAIKKKELNQLDFADLEKFTHLLLKPEYGIVQKLNNQLREIMVDEYQDTNQIQESLILKIAKGEKEIPLFMVGDMKQSIYRFRQADPQIFLDKYNSFSLTDVECKRSKTRRIDLVFNYRSSKVVLDSINTIFNAIMDKQIGGLEYYLDDSARLNYDYEGKETGKETEARERFFNDRHLETEILIDVYNPDSSLDKDSYEAHMVAQRIEELIKDFKINNKPISYKDIVVLMRSTPSFITFKKVFDLYNIPNHIVLSQGLLSSNEAITMMSLLKALNNPYDDVALLSVLTSPFTFSYIDENTIACARINHKDIPLYECLKLSEDAKIKQFIETFDELKDFANAYSPYDLVLKIYELSDYPLFVSHLINGTQRKANLDLFLNIINDLSKNNPYLPDIVEALENSSDYAPASTASKDNDAVEFMTIHKSKGLEFPVVFVCNTHKKFNMQDSKDRIIIDKKLGFVLKPRKKLSDENFKNVIVEYENPYRNMIARVLLDEAINEEMRILYVALTRASQKLILTGVVKDISEITNIQQKLLVNQNPNIQKRKGAENVLLYNYLRKSNNYLTWILSATLSHKDIIKQCLEHKDLAFRANKLLSYDLDKHRTTDSTEHAMFKLVLTDDQKIESCIPTRTYETRILDAATQQKYDRFIYPYDINEKESVAVTALAKLEDDHFLDLTKEQEELMIKAADKGTLVHLFMSYLSFKDDHVDDIINMMYKEELIDEYGKEMLLEYKDNIQAFIDSPIYTMIKDASYTYREKPFSHYDNDRTQIIHGIFDLVFVHNNQVYVLDYKTDHVSTKNSEQSLIEKHKPQLNYYQKVLKEMYKQDIKAIVYYLHIGKYVQF